MNMTANVTSTQVSIPNLNAAQIQDEYAGAMAVKINDQVKQEGAAAVKILDSAVPSPSVVGKVGGNFHAYA